MLAMQASGATRNERIGLFGVEMFSSAVVERFWKYVSKTDGCWEWTGAKDGRGYGGLKVNKKMVKAHRLSWTIHNGDISDDLFCCHHCDNPACVRPEHLFVGTHSDNMRDMSVKGRTTRTTRHRPIGIVNGRAKLTPIEVAEIRSRKDGNLRLSAEFRISVSQIKRIRSNERWHDQIAA